MACVYVLENKINSKCYVGQTIQSFKRRFKRHMESDMLISRALKKYGQYNFNQYIYYLPENLLDYYEIEMIKRINSLYPNGYNLETGGNKNKKVSDIVKQKMGAAKMRKTLGQSNAAKKIVCLNTKTIYDCGMVLGDRLRKTIPAVCKGKRNSAGKGKNGNRLVWAYYGDYLKMTEEEIQNKILLANKKREYTLEERKRISDNFKKMHNNIEFKERLRERMAGENNPAKRDDIREKLKNSKKGYKHSEEAKINIGKAATGRKLSKESILKRLEKMKGYSHSEETRKKISESNKNKIISEESRLKMSIAAKNKPCISNITRNKLSEATKAYWKRRKGL